MEAKRKAAVKDIVTIMAATKEAIPNVLASALDSLHEDALKFQTGLTRGMNLQPDDLSSGRTLKRHTRTLFMLGIRWRHYVDCRSVHEVHRKMCNEFGEDNIGSLKNFENRIAAPIGMKFGDAGRPPKLK